MIEVLHDENFLLHASRYYQNNQCTTTAEFLEDLNRVKYVKKLITRFQETGELKERLILNHIIVLSNVFGYEFLSRMLWLKLEKQFEYVKPFLVMLNVMPDFIYDVRKAGAVNMTGVGMNPAVVERLREI